MVTPNILTNKYKGMANNDLLVEVETACRKHRPDLWEQYFPTKYRYGHSPDIESSHIEVTEVQPLNAGAIDDIGRNSYTLTRGQRLLRVLGCLLAVTYTTNDTTTRTNISTVVGLLQ